MLLGLFLWPGRLSANLFFSGRKKEYRSRRHRTDTPGRVVLLSLVLWLAGAGVLLFALDRAGLLKEALDAGVEMAQGERPAEPVPPPEPEAAAPPEPAPAEAATAGGALAPAEEPPAVALVAPPAAAPPTTPVAPAVAQEAEMWLVILHSIPKTGRDEAERRQVGYKAKGLEVDILDTNAFPRLTPNHWIVALGPFDNRAEALAAADQAKTFNSGLMVRRGL
jgi:cell division protein FtsN